MSGIGRLPTPASAGIGSAIEDDELELLILQLSTTAKAPKPAGMGNISASLSNGHFSTHPRKRHKQKSLMTLWSDRQLLDEIQSEGIKHLLARVQYQWDFSAFSLDRLSNGSNLPTLCTYLFQHHNLISRFRLDTLTTWKFFSLVERGYHSTNPYHNSAHAADVTQAMACFIIEPSIIKYLKPSEIMAALIAAVCHDIDHPGLNEKFLIATSSQLAGLYENSSVLENHHWKSALSILWESGFAQMMTIDDRLEMEGIIKELILATDISRQPEFLSLLRQYQDTGEMDLSLTKYRHFVLQIALKCADISNPCRSWNISRLWSYRACEEFFRQGDRERELGLPVTQVCDRQNISIAKVQSGFYRFIAAPLFEEWNRMLSSPLSKQMLNNLTSNQARWDLIIQQETARSASMAESVASQTSSTSSGGGSLVDGTSSRRESLDPHVSHHRLSRSSVEGDEDSDPCASYPYMQLERGNISTAMCSRRHSLPVQTESFVRSFNTAMAKSNVYDSSNASQLTTSKTTRHPSVPSQSPLIGPQFIRQYSFGERRRSLRQHQFVSVDSHYTSGAIRAITANRRRIFAGNRTPMVSAVESLSSTGSSHSGGSLEKSEGSSFEQDSALTCSDKSYGVATQHHGKVSVLYNRVPNIATRDNTRNKNEICNDNTKNILKSECINQNPHRSVTFQVSGSSESSEHSKDDFELDMEQCKNLVTNLQRNLNYNEYDNSSRRGSAPCNLLLNQIHANKLAMADNSISRNTEDNNKNQNENHILAQNIFTDDYDNVTNLNRRGSLPVNLNSSNQTTLSNIINNSIVQASTMENRNSTNREYRLNYAEKRRQMAHCQKLLDKNGSIDIGMVSPSCRPPMLSQCSSLRSSSFGGIGENGNHNDEVNFAPINANYAYLDNYAASIPDYNSTAMKNANENLEGLAHMLMYRRGSAPIQRQSSLSQVSGMDNCASSALSSDGRRKNYSSKGNINASFGALTERCIKDPSSIAQPNNHKSTPSLSTLLAREHIHAVQSRMQLLQNSSSSAGYYWNSNASSKSKSNPGNNPQTLLNDVVNNCINNGNRNSLIDGSISTTNNNSANIRRGSLPTDFHFYNSFGVC